MRKYLFLTIWLPFVISEALCGEPNADTAFSPGSVPGLSWDGILTLFGTLLAIAISLYSFYKVHNYSKAKDIQNHLDRLLSYAIKYPYLESTICIKELMAKSEYDDTNNLGDKKYSVRYSRYDNYCCDVFNLISVFWDDAGKNIEQKRRILNECGFPVEFIQLHYLWWERYAPRNKITFKQQGLVEYIEDVINQYKSTPNR